MNKTEMLKSQLIQLKDEINQQAGKSLLTFNQQAKTQENMSFSGCNGRLWIQPAADGYDVSLSGASLEKELSCKLQDLFQKQHDGYKQSNANKGQYTQPYWRTDSFKLVKEATKLYSKTKR